jgi:putative hydrolase of the HAD superfamily
VITAIISDFGGVLTTPLEGAFRGYQEKTGIPLGELGPAIVTIGETIGENPLFALETGRLTEAEFERLLGDQLSAQIGQQIVVSGFGEHFFSHLQINPPMIELMRELRGRGLKMGLLTNNVKEWQPLWRPIWPIDELFETVVDSGFVGYRKPGPEIYEITLREMNIEAGAALFIDDMELNCDAARALGMQAVQFRDNDQAIAEIEAALSAARS